MDHTDLLIVNYSIVNSLLDTNLLLLSYILTSFFIRNQNCTLVRSRKLSAYRKREELKEKLLEEVKGHNHSVSEKCSVHCPRNEHYKGPVKKSGLPQRK